MTALIYILAPVADLEEAEPAPPPPLRRRTDAVTHGMLANAKFWSFYCKTWHSQYIQNDFHKQLSDSNKVHKICFRPGLRPGPHWGERAALPQTL